MNGARGIVMAARNQQCFAPLKRAGESLWYWRGGVPLLNLPVPWRLPYGGYFLAHPDAMGARVCGYAIAGHPYEQGAWTFVARVLRQGMTFIDVGANQGFYTILAARRVGACGKVIAFEPAPTERRKLSQNLRLNRLRNVTVVPAAVGNEDSLTRFCLALGHQGSFSSLRQPAEDVTVQTRSITVPVTRLDTYTDNARLTAMHVLKIDVEGGELDVLSGASRSLERFRPFVVCEVEDRRTRQWGYSARQIVDHLKALDYTWFEARADGRLEPRELPGTGNAVSLIAVPIESVPRIQGRE